MPFSATDIIDLIRKRGRGDPPSTLSDVFVVPSTSVLLFLDNKNSFARSEQSPTTIVASLQDIDSLTAIATLLAEPVESLILRLKSDLDEIASNYGILRKSAAPSRGQVVLLRNAALVAPITVPQGRKFFSTQLNQEYKTTETVIVTTMSFNTDLNTFIASIPVESTNVGLNTVAAEDQVNEIRDSIPGMNGVTNITPIIGGRDTETDEELADRIRNILASNNIGSKSGYENLLIVLNDVKDVTVIGAGDPFMFRNGTDGGAVDLYVTDPIAFPVTELVSSSQIAPSGPNFIFSPSRQPIINNVDTVNPPGAINTLGIIKDSGAFSGSLRAQDKIILDGDPTGLVIGYQVNNLIADLQAYIDDDSRKIIGIDALIKEAITIAVDVIVRVRVLSGFSTSLVRTNVETEITKFVSNLGIAQNLEQSDIVKVSVNVAGVDRIDLPPVKFDRATGSVQNVIVAAPNEVFRPGTISALS